MMKILTLTLDSEGVNVEMVRSALDGTIATQCPRERFFDLKSRICNEPSVKSLETQGHMENFICIKFYITLSV